MWDNEVFKCSSFVNGKDFILIECEYKNGSQVLITG